MLVVASGLVRYGGDPRQVSNPDGGDYTGIKYFADDVLPPPTIVESLIGKIGGSVAVGTGSPVPEGTPGDGPGFVGESYDQIIPDAGRLFLGYNDQIGAFGDNSGAFAVTVTRKGTCNP